jgi:hypothetical protein
MDLLVVEGVHSPKPILQEEMVAPTLAVAVVEVVTIVLTILVVLAVLE